GSSGPTLHRDGEGVTGAYARERARQAEVRVVEPERGRTRAHTEDEVVAVGADEDDLALPVVVDAEDRGERGRRRAGDRGDAERPALAQQPGDAARVVEA